MRTAKFAIGQVVKHRLFPFRGVIFDVDPVFSNTEEWLVSIPEDIRPRSDQPFYHLLAENAHDTEYVAYVSEQQYVTLVQRYASDVLLHVFMRAVPEILKRCPKARIVIVGGNEVSYSPKPPAGATYKDIALKEQGGKIDFSRVHILPPLAYGEYLSLLQISSAHVYLTYPFVLSWSLLESMAAGCLVVASKTAPVEEVIREGENGLLVDFFSPEAIAGRVEEAFRRQKELQPVRDQARRAVVERYDLRRICLPAQTQLVEKLAQPASPS